jgi:DNA-binding MarR family transcriptional regulator
MPSTSLTSNETLPQQVAWRLFLTVHALATRRIGDELLAAGVLSFDDYDVLLTVNEAADETMRMSELAEAVLLSNSGMTRRVARLVERGLLHREQSRDDGRVFRVSLTRAGRRALERTWEIYRGQIEENFVRHLSAAEARTIGGIFQRVLDRIGGAEHQGLLDARVTDEPKPRS